MAVEIETADVVIVGAGPAGSTLAGLLAGRGHEVLLLDRAAFPRDKTCGDGLTPRAIPVLGRLGALDELRAARYREIRGACLVAPNGASWHMRFADYDLGLPAFGLTVPRLELDECLRQHALGCGARFRGGVRVAGPLTGGPSVAYGTRAGRGHVVGVEAQADGVSLAIRGRLTVLATGASIGLLRTFGLLEAMPPGVTAIRGYFEGVGELSDEFEFFFDRELSPGYAWVFPLSDGRANIGLGLFNRRDGGADLNLRRLLSEFLARHPRLRDARPVGPLKGYPIRIDFPRGPAIGNGFLLVGEALGLVNPVTGEGIDLAMESAELAAESIDAALARGDTTARGLRPYERALHARYASFFRGVHLLLRLATSPRAIDRLIRQAQRRPRLARTIAGINLGVASPWQAFAPWIWLEILR